MDCVIKCYEHFKFKICNIHCQTAYQMVGNFFLNIFKIWEAEVGREDDKDKDDID